MLKKPVAHVLQGTFGHEAVALLGYSLSSFYLFIFWGLFVFFPVSSQALSLRHGWFIVRQADYGCGSSFWSLVLCVVPDRVAFLLSPCGNQSEVLFHVGKI